jgi:hypothetical protein
MKEPKMLQNKHISFMGALLIVSMAWAERPVQYPIGTVVSPVGNAIASREDQQFHYNWIARLGMNVVENEMIPSAGGYLVWGYIQPNPEEYNWAPYDTVVEDAEAAGLDAYLEIMTWKEPPAWLYEKNPDIYMQTPLGGQDKLTKVIRDTKLDTYTFPSVAHPALIEATEKYVREIARRYKDKKNVRGYIIAEEFGLCAIWPATNYYGIDFSPAMADAFHARLKDKYKTIEAANKAWGHPGRYTDFSEIVWKKGWSHDPKNFRGEWQDYYQTVQHVFADYHNRMARAIHEEDPDAIVMVSDFTAMVSRVGHGAYAPLFTEIDAFAYKSYWNDVRWLTDYDGSQIYGADKQVWCTNFSEDDTTRGGMEQRYMNSEYVRRQFWPAFARGLDGLFLFFWSPWQAEKMSLLQPQGEGFEAIPSIATVSRLTEFMGTHYPTLAKFEPEPAKIAVLDCNVTIIGQHWDFADATKEREKWFTETPALGRYHAVFNRLAEFNRRLMMADVESLAKVLEDPDIQMLCLPGNDLLPAETLKIIEKWIESGKLTVVDTDTAKFTEFSQPVDGLKRFLRKENVLVLQGDRWDREPAQTERFCKFLDQHVPLQYKVTGADGAKLATVDYMSADDGREMAIITRPGTAGRSQDQLEIELNWKAKHEHLTLLDPFAASSRESQEIPVNTDLKAKIVMPGYQDVMLIIAR